MEGLVLLCVRVQIFGDSVISAMEKAPSPEARVLRSHTASVQAVCSLSNVRLCTGDADGQIKLWDVSLQRPQAEWEPPRNDDLQKGVLCLLPREGGRRVLSGLRGGVVTLWDLNDGEPRAAQSFVTGAYHFCRVAASRWSGSGATAFRLQDDEGSHITSAADDVTAAVGAGEGPILPPTSEGPNTPYSELLLCPSADASHFEAWDLRGPRRVHTFTPHSDKSGMCMCLRLLAPKAPYAMAAYEDGSVQGFDLRTMRHSFGAPLVRETALSFDVGPSCEQGVLGAAGQEMVVFELDLSQHTIAKRRLLELKHPGVADVRVRDDEKLFVSGGWDHRVRVWRWKDAGPLAVLRCHTDSVYGLDFSPDLRTLASVGKDARVALWSLYPPST